VRYQQLGAEIQLLTGELDRLTLRHAPALRALLGVGPEVAAELLVCAGDNPARLHSEAAFAALCGTSPVEASSGTTRRHRLNRGGDRHANAALHRIVIVRLRWHQPTRDYVARRTAEGKTKKEILEGDPAVPQALHRSGGLRGPPPTRPAGPANRGLKCIGASKATEALGVTLDHRIGEVELESLGLPAHVAELVRACWELGGRPNLAGLRLRKWAHMLGFGGHFSTKSRRYSTTLGALRRARVAYAIRRRRGHTVPLDAWSRPEDDQAVIAMASWAYLESGYQSTGEAWLAASAAARAREERRVAREELRSTTAAA
jgi:hypothetical protein